LQSGLYSTSVIFIIWDGRTDIIQVIFILFQILVCKYRTMQIASIHQNNLEYSVTEISSAVKRLLEETLGYIRVRGEISGAKLHSSGHFYLTLKDDKSVLNAVCWRGTMSKLKFKPEDGMSVVCNGRITAYAGKSQYQLVVDYMEPAGIGALMARLEQLKKKLLAEGLFEEARKKPLPFMPQTIAVITSPTGAVIRDILHRLQERFPVNVIIYPVAVQGDAAAGQVAEAINYFNTSSHRPDVIIVARGGGSIEDLWAFNEEVVVRATANSVIPIISAVGHETDTTLIDYAADLRAPTPTAAAEKAVPVKLEIATYVAELNLRLTGAMTKIISSAELQLTSLTRGLQKADDIFSYPTQRVDEMAERLQLTLPAIINLNQQKLAAISAGLRANVIEQRIDYRKQVLENNYSRIFTVTSRYLSLLESSLQKNSALLGALDFHNTLKRGYVMAKNEHGKIISSSLDVPHAEPVILTFHDGEVLCRPVD